MTSTPAASEAISGNYAIVRGYNQDVAQTRLNTQDELKNGSGANIFASSANSQGNDVFQQSISGINRAVFDNSSFNTLAQLNYGLSEEATISSAFKDANHNNGTQIIKPTELDPLAARIDSSDNGTFYQQGDENAAVGLEAINSDGFQTTQIASADSILQASLRDDDDAVRLAQLGAPDSAASFIAENNEGPVDFTQVAFSGGSLEGFAVESGDVRGFQSGLNAFGGFEQAFDSNLIQGGVPIDYGTG